MFMLYAIALGVLCGFALRGSPDGLGTLRFRWAGVAFAGLAAQVALFSSTVTAAIGDVGAPVYVASSAVVLAVVVRNIALPGLPIVAAGAAANLAAIVANGGWMPASASALASLGETIGEGYSNSRVVASPALAPLTDVLALPRWLPFANVFSIGDVLIGLGVAVAIVVAMRRTRAAGVTVDPVSVTATRQSAG